MVATANTSLCAVLMAVCLLLPTARGVETDAADDLPAPPPKAHGIVDMATIHLPPLGIPTLEDFFHRHETTIILLTNSNASQCDVCEGIADMFRDAVEKVNGTTAIPREHMQHQAYAILDANDVKSRGYLAELRKAAVHHSVPVPSIIHGSSQTLKSPNAPPHVVMNAHFTPSEVYRTVRHVALPRIALHHERHLIDAIFEDEADGVAVVVYAHGDRGTLVQHAIHSVRHHNRYTFPIHHTLHVDTDTSDYSFVKKYNPDNYDVVAYVADPGTETFHTEGFNFTHNPAHRTAWAMTLDFRHWLDQIKTMRHRRQFHGVVGHHQYDVEEPIEGCREDVVSDSGDVLVVNVTGVGSHVIEAAPFMTLTNAVVQVGEPDGRFPKLVLDAFRGLCEGYVRRVFVPATHGFHGEHYDISVVMLNSPRRSTVDNTSPMAAQPHYHDEEGNVMEDEPTEAVGEAAAATNDEIAAAAVAEAEAEEDAPAAAETTNADDDTAPDAAAPVAPPPPPPPQAPEREERDSL